MSIRTAIDDDVAEIARILKQSREVAIPYALIPYSLDEIEHWVRSVLIKVCRVYVIDDASSSKLTGVAASSNGWLEQLYLDPEFFGRGYGTRLLEFVKKQNVSGLSLHCFQKNVRARQFYEKHDFDLIEYRDGSANEEGVPDCVYRWPGVIRSD